MRKLKALNFLYSYYVMPIHKTPLPTNIDILIIQIIENIVKYSIINKRGKLHENKNRSKRFF